MEAQDIDQQASTLELNRENVHLYLLAGKQAVRIDMLENALNLSESQRREMQTRIEELEAQRNGDHHEEHHG